VNHRGDRWDLASRYYAAKHGLCEVARRKADENEGGHGDDHGREKATLDIDA
jgi:hypothetical protein